MKKNFWGQVCLASIFVFLSAHPAFAQIGDVREYVIGIGDQFSINVWGIPELSSQVGVRQDGKITMPRLGDIQAAGLKISSLKAYLIGEEEGKETIGKYVKNPNITISLVRPAENIRISIRGAISQILNVPRQTQIGQVLQQLVSQLPSEPPPDVQNILVVSAEGEEFPVNWPELQSGQASYMDVRLEWGDEIRIPAGTLPEPTPTSTPSAPPQVSYSEEELQQLLQEYPEVMEPVMAAASEIDDGVYHFDLAEMSEAQQEALGADIIALLFYGSVDALPEDFTNITLVGISVNLRFDDVLEAYLAFPSLSPESLPVIERFREGDLIEKGSSEGEDIYLEEIRDDEMMVIVRQGETRQNLSLTSSFSEAMLSGIFRLENGTKAVFSNLPERQSRRPRKRMFLEGEKIDDEVKVAKISNQWVMLQKGEEIQVLLLRDSFNRPVYEAPTPPLDPVASVVGEGDERPIPPGGIEQPTPPDPVAPIVREGDEQQIPQNGIEQRIQNLSTEEIEQRMQNLSPEEREQLMQNLSLEEIEQLMQNFSPEEREQLIQNLPQGALDTFNELFFAAPVSE